MHYNAGQAWLTGSHHRKPQKAQHSAVFLRKRLRDTYTLTWTHEHRFSMCSPENYLERVPSTSGPFASSLLCSPYPRRCSHRGPHHTGNISMAGNPERRTLLCHTGNFFPWASFTSPAHCRLSSILPDPPLPFCTNFLHNAVFPSPHICIL